MIKVQQGNEGEDVRNLQLGLLRLGYPLPDFGADGIYGPETASAVEQWKISTSPDLLNPAQDGSFVTETQWGLIVNSQNDDSFVPPQNSGYDDSFVLPENSGVTVAGLSTNTILVGAGAAALTYFITR